MAVKIRTKIEKKQRNGYYRIAISPKPTVLNMICVFESLLEQMKEEMPFSLVARVEATPVKNYIEIQVENDSLVTEALKESVFQYKKDQLEYFLQSGISVQAFMNSVRKLTHLLGRMMTKENHYLIREWSFDNGFFKFHTLPYTPVLEEVLLLIDGPNMLSRAYYGTKSKPLKTSAGVPTHGVHRFIERFFQYMRNIQPRPTHVVVLWDSDRESTLRRERYPEYKANRKPKPGDLEIQFTLIKELLDDMNIPQYTVKTFEADDAIYTFAKRWVNEKSAPCYIISNDKDLFQLINAKTKIIGKWKDEEEVLGIREFTDQYGIEPSYWIDVKGLVGDPSDNLPGCPGVGETKVYDIIRTFGRLEDVIASVDAISESSQFKRYAKPLREGKEEALLTKELATLVDVAELHDKDLSEIKLTISKEGMIRGFERLEFNSFLERMNR